MKMLRIVADKEKCNDTYKQRGNYLRANNDKGKNTTEACS